MGATLNLESADINTMSLQNNGMQMGATQNMGSADIIRASSKRHQLQNMKFSEIPAGGDLAALINS